MHILTILFSATNFLFLYYAERNDVAKHKNMGLFYNHLFKQRMGETDTVTPTIKEEPPEVATSSTAEQELDPCSSTATDDATIKKRDDRARANNYRKRVDDDESPTREESSKNSRNDSDSVDSSDEGDASTSPKLIAKHKDKISKKSKYSSANETDTSKCNVHAKDEPNTSADEDTHEKSDKTAESMKAQHIKIKKEETKEMREDRIRKLFMKRTVGEAFIEAQKRYFQRKSERGA